MKIGQSQPILGESIQRWRGNLTAESTNIRITHVIDNNEQDIGLLNGRLVLSLFLRILTAGGKLHDHQHETYK